MRNKTLGTEQLVKCIIEKIEQSPIKAISFKDYMELCLYHPKLGYYRTARTKVGKDGDFYTSSSIGTLMGEMMARFIVRLKQQEQSPEETFTFVEWGGGTGRLALHMLDELRSEYPAWYEASRYVVIEQSPYHRELQQQTLQEHLLHVAFMTELEWFEQGKTEGAIVFSNELLDAFPVHRVQSSKGIVYEICVAWNETEKCFYEKLVPLAKGMITAYFEQECIHLRDGQTAEVNLEAARWIRSIGRWLESGHVITIDYGDLAEEIYAEHRNNGTLMCYYQHHAHDNPYIHIGQQDITSHVNFSACIRFGQGVGLSESSLTTQKEFLIRAGIMEKLQDHSQSDPFHPAARKNRAIRQLLISDQMSELFKVLIQTKKR